MVARDVLPALLLSGYAAFEVLSGVAPGVAEVPGDPAVSAPAAVAAAAAVGLRRRLPVLGLACCVAAQAVEALVTTPAEGLAGLVAVLLLVYAVALRCSTGVAVVALAVAVPVLGLLQDDLVFLGVLLAVPWLAGRVLGERQRALAQVQVSATQDTAVAIAEERRHIARELHDVVSHALSLVVVQSQLAQATVRSDPTTAEAALGAVKDAAQTALADMRRMLGVLSDGTTVERAPQPGLTELPQLLDRVRAAGLRVVVREEGRPRELTAGASLIAYRVLQEGLTNALRHAGGHTAQVRLVWSSDALVLRVTDDGTVPPYPAAAGSGVGLVGLRERVVLYGGTLRAGPARAGGFELEAVLPA